MLKTVGSDLFKEEKKKGENSHLHQILSEEGIVKLSDEYTPIIFLYLVDHVMYCFLVPSE